jgi:hypothetical protein
MTSHSTVIIWRVLSGFELSSHCLGESWHIYKGGFF